MRRWVALAALAVAILLTSVIGSVRAEADGPDKIFFIEEKSGETIRVRNLERRTDVKVRFKFKDGFSAELSESTREELEDEGFTIREVPIYYPTVNPSDQTPYSIEQIYNDPSLAATTGGAGITIAHLDTGIDWSHPDLAAREAGCKDATGVTSIPSDPATIVLPDGCSDWHDHGTHTAGSAVADGGPNGTGIYGVAPDAKLYSIKVCSPSGGGSCPADSIAAAIHYIGTNNLAEIVSMSLGGNSFSQDISDAIGDYPNLLFIAAAGNDGGTNTIDYPARDPRVVAIAAIDDNKAVADFSSRGLVNPNGTDPNNLVIEDREIEFAAGGDRVLSTIRGGGYAFFSGTSMSTPQVAGLAAKEWQGNASNTRAYLRNYVEDITDSQINNDSSVGVGFDRASGFGLVHISPAAPPVLSSIDVSPINATIDSGDTQQFQATGNYSDGSSQDLSGSASWNSSNTSVASIDNNGLANGLTGGNTSITAFMSSITSNIATLNVVVPPPVLTSIQVTPANASIDEGDNQQYQATGNYSDGSSQDITGSASWNSSNNNVASIDNNGLANGLTGGTTDITASMSGIISNTASLEVIAAPPVLTSIAVSPVNASIQEGDTQQYLATGSYSDGSSQDLTGSSSWISSVPGVASIDGNGLASGIQAGNTDITASMSGVTSNTATLEVVAPPAVLTSIAVTPANASIEEGDTQAYNAVGIYSDGTSQDITNSVIWNSSNLSIATIGASGLATGILAGNTDISASMAGVNSNTVALEVTVPPPPSLLSIAVTPVNASVQEGDTQQYQATGDYSDGSTQDLTTFVSWNSSLSGVATIDSNGLATAILEGSTDITASSNGINSNVAVLEVTKVPPPVVLVTIEVTPAAASIDEGDSQQYMATGNYSDGNSLNITAFASWNSSNTSVASIDGNGLASGLTGGTTEIAASLDGVTSNPASLEVIAPPPVVLVTIEVTPANASIDEGDSQQYMAMGNYSDGTSQDITASASWNSSLPGVASIDSNGLASGLLGGTTDITASLDGITSNPASLEVIAPPPVVLVTIEVTPANASIDEGDSQQYMATGNYSDGSSQDVTTSASWNSSLPGVASIDGNGLANGIQEGNTDITASMSGVTSNTATLEVIAPPPVVLVTIEVTPANASIDEGDSQQYQATGNYSDGSSQDISGSASWDSSDANVASIDGNGLASGLVAGTTMISASMNGITGTAKLEVVASPTQTTLVALEITPMETSIMTGGEQSYTAMAKFSDGTAEVVTDDADWHSSDPSVASISGSGEAKGKSAGESKITASLKGMTSEGGLLQVVAPPVVDNLMHIGDLEGNTRVRKRSWRAIAEVTVHNADDEPVRRARVIGRWNIPEISEDDSSSRLERLLRRLMRYLNRSHSCSTNSNGECKIYSPSLLKMFDDVTFEVTNVKHRKMDYDASANHDVDGDSDGTTIEIEKP